MCLQLASFVLPARTRWRFGLWASTATTRRSSRTTPRAGRPSFLSSFKLIENESMQNMNIWTISATKTNGEIFSESSPLLDRVYQSQKLHLHLDIWSYYINIYVLTFEARSHLILMRTFLIFFLLIHTFNFELKKQHRLVQVTFSQKQFCQYNLELERNKFWGF